MRPFCTANGDTRSYQLSDPVVTHMTKFTHGNSPFEVNDNTCMKKGISVSGFTRSGPCMQNA